MRNFFFLIITSFSINLSVNAQIGAVVPDFTEYDIEGNEHHIYDYLDQGKFVIIDLFATWCSPCWSLHNSHALDSIYYEFGPEGTDQVVVLAIERSIDTGMDELMGIGPSTYGDWITGTPYPIIDVMTPTPPELYAGLPAVTVICPYDRKIKDYLWGWPNPLEIMRTRLAAAMDSCNVLANIDESSIETDHALNIYPNPTSNIATLSFRAFNTEFATLSVLNILGVTIETKTINVLAGSNKIQVDLQGYEAGTYIIQVQMNASILTTKLEVTQ